MQGDPRRMGGVHQQEEDRRPQKQMKQGTVQYVEHARRTQQWASGPQSLSHGRQPTVGGERFAAQLTGHLWHTHAQQDRR
ncbi:MAG: hypothetical protein IPM07_13385 [Anaerolineales bacterium]|nr:hypothetical protein [Anaerolineales bacterium]